MHTARRDHPTVRQHPRRHRRSISACIFAVALACLAAPTNAQTPAPAFVDDSTLAAETLAQLDELTRAGSLREAARALQRLLDTEADRLLIPPRQPAPADQPGSQSIYRPVRDAVHDALLARPALLAAYIEQQTPEAQRLLDAGRHADAERTRLLTPPGFEATLRTAQHLLESARFHAARRTLAQLEHHPLAADPAHAAEALRLARLIAAYTPGTDTDHLKRWADRAALPTQPTTPAESPAGLAESDLPALSPAGIAGPSLAGIVPTPLHAVTLPAAESWATQSRRGLAQTAHWAIPAILDNTVFINDGDALAAYDRFTLRQLWRAPVPPPNEGDIDSQAAQRLRNRTRQIEDPTTVTLADGAAYAALGVVVSGRREGDERVIRVNTDTGDIQWAIVPATLTDELESASVRGPLVADGDTLVITLRKNQRSRRTVAVYLAGVHTETGALLWTRLVGSVGALPYQQMTRTPQAVLAHRGVALLTDEIGLTAAIDTASGRPLWVRLDTPLPAQSGRARPWATHQPIPAGDAFVALSPDQTEIRRIELETGNVLARRDTARFGSPSYLIPLNAAPQGAPTHDDTQRVAAIGETVISVFDPETLEPLPGGTDLAGPFGDITARVLAAGNTLIAPVPTGVALVDTTAGQPTVSVPVNVDATGNITVASGQLLVADDTRLRSYLIWDAAADMLRGKINDNPGDPEPAVTFAELAFRAGRTDEIVPAIDLAIAALGKTPSPETAARLFDVTLSAIDEALPPSDEQNAAPDQQPLAANITSELITRLGRLADAPEQRVAHLLALGRLREASGNDTAAADTYQRILTDPTLASTSFRGPRVSIRAELEAERRLHTLVRRAGAAIYEPFNAAAAAERVALGPTPTPDALATLARRYPLAPAAATARLEEAGLRSGSDDHRRALHASGSAVAILRNLHRDGVVPDPVLIGRAFGAHALALAAASRPADAASLIADARADFPGVTLLDGDAPLSTDEMFDDLTRRLAERRTHPRLGPALAIDDEPQLIQGYVLRPLARAEPGGVSRARFDGALIVNPPEGTLAWHTPAAAGTADTAAVALEAAWTREVDRDPLLLRIDEISAWVFWPDETGGWVERIDLADGTALWTSSPWTELIGGVEIPDEDDRARARSRFIDPIEGRVRTDELLVTLDARTIILVERGGRAAAIDTATGQPLWASSLETVRVYDVDTAADVLALGGMGEDREGRLVPVLVTLDPRTGEAISTDRALPGEVRWVRISAGGDVLAGLRTRIVSVSPADARANWTLENPQIVETDDAWLLGDALVVRSVDDNLWMIDAGTGRAARSPLETRGRINTSDRVVAERFGSGDGERLLFSGSDGVCLFDADGSLVGIDAFTQPSQMMPAAVAEDGLAVLKIERGRFGLGGTRYVMNLLSADSARVTEAAAIRLFGEPSAVEAIDGRVLISAGEATLVVRVPAE